MQRVVTLFIVLFFSSVGSSSECSLIFQKEIIKSKAEEYINNIKKSNLKHKGALDTFSSYDFRTQNHIKKMIRLSYKGHKGTVIESAFFRLTFLNRDPIYVHFSSKNANKILFKDALSAFENGVLAKIINFDEKPISIDLFHTHPEFKDGSTALLSNVDLVTSFDLYFKVIKMDSRLKNIFLTISALGLETVSFQQNIILDAMINKFTIPSMFPDSKSFENALNEALGE